MLRPINSDSNWLLAQLAAILLCMLLAGCQCAVTGSRRRACDRFGPTPAMSISDASIDDAALAPTPEASHDERAEVVEPLGEPPETVQVDEPSSEISETVAEVVSEVPGDVVSSFEEEPANACGIEHEGACGEEICGFERETPRWRFPRFRMPRWCFPVWCGPLLHRGMEPGLVEEELRPPHSRFHPVPTRPVFEPRMDYAIPQLMMMEAEKPGMLHRPLAGSGPLGDGAIGSGNWQGKVMLERDLGQQGDLRQPMPPENQ